MRPAQLTILLALCSIGRLACVAETIEKRELQYRTAIRAVTFAEEGETINNPLSWPQLEYVVPDGAYVEEGGVLTEFDRESLTHRLEDLRYEEEVVRADLERKLTELRNRDMSLKDELAGLRDQLAVFQTQLARYRALPDPDDVAIAHGRVHLAELEFEAAKRDFETARSRFQRGMISPAEKDRFERAHLESEARLEYRRGLLRIASRQARPSLLKRIELRMANVQMELDRLQESIRENERLSDIEIRGAKASVELLEQRIDECTKDLERTTLRSPRSGYVTYLPMFRQHAGRTGEKMWKNFAFLRIPDTETVALKGTLLETDRRYFSVGDEVLVRATARQDQLLAGRIASFGAMPHDRGEKDEGHSAQDSESGIMVYDVVIELASPPEWLRVGMTAECTLLASAPVTGPSIPATYVRVRDGTSFLSLDGVYRPVEGVLVDGFFVLNDPSLDGREVGVFGHFPEDENEASRGTGAGHRATGELVPADTVEAVVGNIHRWQKVAWVIPEDTEVQEGDVVARLDTVDTDEEIKERESELRQAASQREREEEQLKQRTKENAFHLARAENLLEITRLEQEEVLEPLESATVLRARMDVVLGEIRLEFLERRLRRVEASERTALSPLEISRLRRDRRRAELQLELARLQLAEAAAGPDEAERARAELSVLERELDVSALRTGLETDYARRSYELRRAERYERHRQERLDHIRMERENLVVKAPRAGLVRYLKVWNAGRWTKVDVGCMVGHRTALMSVADVSRMYIRLELPERFYTAVATGMAVEVRIPSISDAVLTGRVTEIEFLFERKRRKDSERGLYSSHEALGETIFHIRVEVDSQHGVMLKPGAMAEVFFPFES